MRDGYVHVAAFDLVDAAIETQRLSKDYGGGRGVFDVDLTVQRGEVFGFLGPNGAGKTTTIRVLLDLIRPTAGTARVLGLDPHRDGVELRRHVGYLPGELAMAEERTGARLLSDLAALRGGVDPARMAELVALLGAETDVPIRHLSKGNKQKLGIVQAFFHDPELLILDEPTDGLDPLLRQRVHGLIHDAARRGKTVFLSSHVIHEVEQVCDRVAIIKDGRLGLVAPMADIKMKMDRHMLLRLREPPAPTVFRGIAGVYGGRRVGDRIELRFRGPAGPALAAASAYGIIDVETPDADLEHAFLALYGEDRRD